eukprot:CAMPEP_0116915604 /NCGR_PEP_ID=MMETSP0467-20121206/18031_1 /TAXON_ID=283647 /ORGANISM="Mesodinium pulex, Strain SPMC105" /LENGTH=74 /DNA_ID=CAMNT_0004592307 /DNA_START=727 /DNA_END=951 /DNA_ORIENTATION=-
MAEMKKQGKKCEIEDEMTNIDEHLVDKFDPMRVRHTVGTIQLQKRISTEEGRHNVDQKRNPNENIFKRNDFIKD